MEGSRINRVEAFISHVLDNDRLLARNCLSEDFGIDNGMTAEQYIDHEIDEFLRRRHLLCNGFRVMPFDSSAPDRDSMRYLVFDAQGKFVFEDVAHFDRLGRLRGNQKEIEIISKIKIAGNGRMRRAMAARTRYGRILRAILHSDAAFLDLRDSTTYGEDRFQYIEFAEAEESCHTKSVLIRFFYGHDDSIRTESRMVMMRGTDHPLFRNAAPRIFGKEIVVPDTGSHAWSMAIYFRDGSHQVVDYPAPGRHVAKMEVEKVILTDALDNDWEVDA